MTKSLALLFALLSSNAWATAGDDSLSALMVEDFPRALKIAKPAAEKGDYLAQLILARIHDGGMGVPVDKDEANKWFPQALAAAKPLAEGGDPRAQYVVGRMLADGWGTPQDPAAAVDWYRKAADQGHGPAQVNLALAHLSGFGGAAKSEKTAYGWLSKSAEQKMPLAQHYRALLLEQGKDVPRDEKEAAVWYRKAADMGLVRSMVNLAQLYHDGRGVAKDYKAAFKWYLKAAEKGNAEAQDRVGTAYMQGKGVASYGKTATIWFQKSAEQGYPAGQFSYGVAYEFGVGVPKDSSEAMAWYRKAADQGYEPARSRLLKMEIDLGIRQAPPVAAAPVAAAPAASSAVTKEDIREMIQSAMKPAEAPAPKGISSDVDKPGYTTPENPDNFAVVIGVEKYASLPAADFAERDAESVRAHLMAMGYPARNIFFLSGQQATRSKIAQSVNTWLPGRVTPASTVFFYYSGHGAPDPRTNQAYLVPTDGDPEDLDSTAYPIKLLYEKLGKLKSKQVIVALDSCFSGAGGRSVLAKGTRPLVGKIDMGGLPDTVVALTASDKSQISGTIEDQGHGAFTYYMLKGLEGGAKNAAGRVTAQSLHEYLTPKVRDAARLSNREQTPQLMNGKRAGTALR